MSSVEAEVLSCTSADNYTSLCHMLPEVNCHCASMVTSRSRPAPAECSRSPDIRSCPLLMGLQWHPGHLEAKSDRRTHGTWARKERVPRRAVIKTRGFCWLPPLMLESSGKWGAVHILTIDEGDGPYVFRIIRLKSTRSHFEVHGVWLVRPDAVEQRSSAANATTLSQSSSPIGPSIRIDAQEWKHYRNIGVVQTKIHLRGALDGAEHRAFLLEVVLNDDARPARGQEPPEGFQCCSTPDLEGMQQADPRFADFHTALDTFNSAGHHKVPMLGHGLLC